MNTQDAALNHQLLFEIAEKIRRAENPEALLFSVAEAVGKGLQVRRCLFNEIDLDRDRETIHRDYCRGVTSVAGVHLISSYSSVTTSDMIGGKTVVNRDSRTDPRTAQFYEQTYAPAGERAYVAVPLLRGGRWVASLWVSDDRPRDWSDAEISLLEMTAERAWLAVEKLRSEATLRESEERYRTLFNSIDEGFCVCEMLVDAEGKPHDYRFLEINPTFEKHTGLQGAQGRTARELVPNLEERWFSIYGKVALRGEPVRFIDGSEAMKRWFDVYAFPIGPPRERKFAIIFNNITARKQFEAERERLLRREQELRQTAEEANRLKDEFLATVSHELRTPLTSILGWSSLLRQNAFDTATQDRALETIQRNAKAQQQIIEDLLEVSRIITGKLRMDTEAVELPRVIEAALDTVRPAAAAKNIHLRATLDSDTGPVAGDTSRLQQVVWNLLTNAVKFTPPAGLIEVRLARVDSQAEIIVSDNGIGIGADFLPYVFDRFRQADGTTRREHGGLGLGLAIVRHLVEAHGGTVSVFSEGKGRGADFSIKLPLLPLDRPADGGRRGEAPPVSLEASRSQPTARALEGVQVLLVDDDDDARGLLAVLLSGHGAMIMEAESAALALSLFDQHRPDVLVSDIGMPGEDGYDLIKQVRGREINTDLRTPAVALTAYARADDRDRALVAGYDLHLPKPVEPATVVATIVELVNRPSNPRLR